MIGYEEYKTKGIDDFNSKFTFTGEGTAHHNRYQS